MNNELENQIEESRRKLRIIRRSLQRRGWAAKQCPLITPEQSNALALVTQEWQSLSRLKDQGAKALALSELAMMGHIESAYCRLRMPGHNLQYRKWPAYQGAAS